MNLHKKNGPGKNLVNYCTVNCVITTKLEREETEGHSQTILSSDNVVYSLCSHRYKLNMHTTYSQNYKLKLAD